MPEFRPGRGPVGVFVDGASTWLEDLSTGEEMERFLEGLWVRLWRLYGGGEVYEGEVEECVNGALGSFIRARQGEPGLFIRAAHYAGVMRVAREMLERHFIACELLEMDMQMWGPKMAGAVGRVVPPQSTVEGGENVDAVEVAEGSENLAEVGRVLPTHDLPVRVRATRVLVALPGTV